MNYTQAMEGASFMVRTFLPEAQAHPCKGLPSCGICGRIKIKCRALISAFFAQSCCVFLSRYSASASGNACHLVQFHVLSRKALIVPWSPAFPLFHLSRTPAPCLYVGITAEYSDQIKLNSSSKTARKIKKNRIKRILEIYICYHVNSENNRISKVSEKPYRWKLKNKQ